MTSRFVAGLKFTRIIPCLFWANLFLYVPMLDDFATLIGIKKVSRASPHYLAKRPPIKTLDDLMQCDFIAMAMLPDTITLVCKDEQISFQPENVRLEVYSVSSAKSAVLEGLGVQHLPDSEVDIDIAEGRLVEVLPQWSPPDLGIYAVWPDIGPQKKLTHRLIEFLQKAELATDNHSSG